MCNFNSFFGQDNDWMLNLDNSDCT